MTDADRVLNHPFLLFTAYSVALIGSFILVVHFWALNGFISSLGATQSMSPFQLVTTYSLTVILVPWLTVTIQSFIVWFQTRLAPGVVSFRAIWRVVFLAFVIPQTIRGLITNAVFASAGHPVAVSFGLGLLGPVPPWIDFVTDAFFLAQLVLFFLFFNANEQPAKRLALVGGVAVGRILASLLI